MQVNTNEVGIVVEVEHGEIDSVLAAAATGGSSLAAVLTPIFVAAGISGPIGAAIIAGLGAYIAGEAFLVKQCDKGNGVYLTMSWLALGVVVPTTRPGVTPLPQPRWSDKDSGNFGTRDRADSIRYEIQRGALGNDAITFRLFVGEQSSGWKKAINLPDGEGNSWDIEAEGRGGWAENGIWANQVNNGQKLTFKKAKMLGRMPPVLELGDLGGLRRGDVVEFHWDRD